MIFKKLRRKLHSYAGIVYCQRFEKENNLVNVSKSIRVMKFESVRWQIERCSMAETWPSGWVYCRQRQTAQFEIRVKVLRRVSDCQNGCNVNVVVTFHFSSCIAFICIS